MTPTSKPSARVYPTYCSAVPTTCRPSSPVLRNVKMESAESPLSINAAYVYFQYRQRKTEADAFNIVNVARTPWWIFFLVTPENSENSKGRHIKQHTVYVDGS